MQIKSDINSIFLDNLMKVLPQERIKVNSSNVKSVLDAAYTTLKREYFLPVNLFGENVKIMDAKGAKTSLEVLPTYRCNAHCKFCIANMHSRPQGELSDNDFLTFTNEVIQEYKKNSLNFEMRVTGGEPFVLPTRLKDLLALIAKNKVSHYRVNTNGSLLNSRNVELLKPYAENEPFLLDVSRHHQNDGINDTIFGKQTILSENLAELNYKLRQKIMLRSVLIKGYLDSLDSIKEFIDYFKKLGFNIFSFKNLTSFNPTKNGEMAESFFIKNHSIDFLDIVNSAAQDSEFKFKNQIIESETVRELYTYNGTTVKFSYLDPEQPEKLSNIEHSKGENVLRRGIVFPDGRLATYWDKENSTIYKYQ